MPPKRRRQAEDRTEPPKKYQKTSEPRDSTQKKGRSKIPIEFIEDASRRSNAFCKRKTGLFKKAGDISILTGCSVFVALKRGKKVYTFGTRDLDYLGTSDEGNERFSELILQSQRNQKLWQSKRKLLDDNSEDEDQTATADSDDEDDQNEKLSEDENRHSNYYDMEDDHELDEDDHDQAQEDDSVESPPVPLRKKNRNSASVQDQSSISRFPAKKETATRKHNKVPVPEVLQNSTKSVLQNRQKATQPPKKIQLDDPDAENEVPDEMQKNEIPDKSEPRSRAIHGNSSKGNIPNRRNNKKEN